MLQSSREREPFPLNANRKEIKAMARLLSQKPLTLADYHAIGEQMHRLERDTSVVGHGRAWRQRVAEILETSDSTLSKCLQFFNCYEPGDLAELERLAVAALRLEVGWVQLFFALGIPDQKKRHRLLQQARDNGWGQKDLRREVHRLKGSYRGGGRPRIPEKSRGCLADASELVLRTQQWSAFYEQAWRGNDKKYIAELDKLSDEGRESLERVLADAAERLEALHQQCTASLATVKALQEKLTQQSRRGRRGQTDT
jgi:hypothetical protein